jgi:hypothetical protein
MYRLDRQNDKKNWIRFALKAGLLATDAGVWMAIRRILNERDPPAQRVAVEPRRAREVSQADRKWISPSTALLGGIGIGVGLGMLLAPVSGTRARSAIRDKALDVKDRVGDAADWLRSGKYRASAGTYGY